MFVFGNEFRMSPHVKSTKVMYPDTASAMEHTNAVPTDAWDTVLQFSTVGSFREENTCPRQAIAVKMLHVQ